MSLVSLVDSNRTDKNTTHSYLPLYDTLLESRRLSAKNVLEVGIERGGSIALWNDYFQAATVYGLDCQSYTITWDKLKTLDRVRLLNGVDAYTLTTVELFKTFNIKFDVLIDDGPHTLDSMLFFVSNYSSLLSDTGIMIVEDIPHEDYLPQLLTALPPHLRSHATVYDLRPKKNRYDDIVLVVDLTVQA